MSVNIKTDEKLIDETMRQTKSYSLDPEIIDQVKKRAEKRHVTESRELEAILRKALRL